MKIYRSIAALFLTAISLPAFAQNDDISWYAGADWGVAHYRDSGEGCSFICFGEPVYRNYDRATAYRLKGGVLFTPVWGLEASYVDMGQAEGRMSDDLPGTPPTTTRSRAWVLAVTGGLPIYNWTLGLRAGYVRSHVEFVANSTTISTDGNRVTYGIYLDWRFSPRWSAQLSDDWYGLLGEEQQTGEFSVTAVTLGLAYHFD